MTNELTPQQLLEIARVVEDDKQWRIDSDLVVSCEIIWNQPLYQFEPRKPTERGKAQLWCIFVAFCKAEMNNPDAKETVEEIIIDYVKHDRIDDALWMMGEVICNAQKKA